MDISKFKSLIQKLIQKLSIFKGYSSLLMPIVIGLAAVLLFVPTQLMSNKLKKQIANKSISSGKKVRSLSKSARARDQWKVEQAYQEVYESDANQIALLAAQSTERQLLSYKIFPGPKDTSPLIFDEFGQQFRLAVEESIARINARDCPTDAELERVLGRPSSTARPHRSTRKLSSKSQEYETTIMDEICREKAESASVYANPADLSGYEFWEEYEYAGTDEAVKDCWYWQLGYWIIEDVIDTVGSLNSGSNSVFTSPVKRLLSVSFIRSTGRSRESRGKAAVRPSYVLSIEDGLCEPWTGRISNNDNNDIDVVHFNVAVVVSTRAVLPFMRQLCSAKQHKFRGWFGREQEQIFKHNQITILESSIGPIDPKDSEYEKTHGLYRYGEDAVVELDLICEYIFNKNGYDEIKPELVKEKREE